MALSGLRRLMEPLFVSDIDTLKSRLRMSGVDVGDSAAMLNAVVEEVRLGLFRELGSNLIAELQAIIRSDAPITREELRRLRAENVEYLWCRLLLLRRMPVMMLQSAGDGRHRWNQEGITRDATRNDVTREVNDMWRLVLDGIAELLGQDTGMLTATVIEPDQPPQRPGDSIRPFGIRPVLRSKIGGL